MGSRTRPSSPFGYLFHPFPNKTAIARFLDYVDRRSRRYIRAKEKLIALLEEQKQAIIHQAVTGQVDVRTGQPYPAYKDSGVEWLGQCRSIGKFCNLGDSAQFFKGAGEQRKTASGLRGVPCVRYGDLYTTHEFFRLSSCRAYVTEEHAADYTPLRYGDDLCLLDRVRRLTRSVCRQSTSSVKANIDPCCGGDVVVFGHAGRTCSARFLGYSTDCWTASTQNSTMGRGITVMHVYAENES